MDDQENDKYTITFETWNKVASIYQDKFMDLDIYNDTYDFFCSAIIGKHPRILEIGCGPGNITRYLQTKRQDFQIDATDIAPNMIDLATKNNPTVACYILDAKNIETLETKFDGIMCGFCLPYLSWDDVRKFIKDCFWLLHIDGIFYISFIEGDYEKSGYQYGSTWDRTYLYYHSRENLLELLRTSGFNIIYSSNKNYKKSNIVSDIHTIVIAKKDK